MAQLVVVACDFQVRDDCADSQFDVAARSMAISSVVFVDVVHIVAVVSWVPWWFITVTWETGREFCCSMRHPKAHRRVPYCFEIGNRIDPSFVACFVVMGCVFRGMGAAQMYWWMWGRARCSCPWRSSGYPRSATVCRLVCD